MASSGSAIGAAAGDARGDLLGLLGDVVVDDDDPGARDLVVMPGDVIGAHHADTEDGDTEVRHGVSGLLVS